MSNATSLHTPKYRHHKCKGLAVVTIVGRDSYLGKHCSVAMFVRRFGHGRFSFEKIGSVSRLSR